MDPLTLLREFLSTGRLDEEVVLVGDRVDFGGKFSFNKNVATGYKSQQGKGQFYDLETLLFFARHINSKFSEYFKKANKEIGKAVTFVDRRDLQEYLTGGSDRSEFIQLAVPDLEVGHPPPTKRARVEGGDVEAAAAAAAAAEGQGAAAAAAAAAGVATLVEEDAEGAELRRIRENELQLRDRNSMLSVPGRSFRKVLDLLAQAQHMDQKEAAARQREAARSKGKQPAKPVLPVRPSGRYERQTQQDATLRQLGAAELGVQMGFRPAAAGGAGASVPPPPSSQQQQQQQQQQGSGGAGPSSAARPSAAPQLSSGAGSSRAHAPQPPPQQQRRPSGSAAAKPGPPPRQGTPIILVPPGMTSLFTMYNIQQFLEKGTFATSDDSKEVEVDGQRVAVAKPDRITLQRTTGRTRPVKYYVTDKEPTRTEEWQRVVAVFCLGKAWQFKKWPFKGSKSSSADAPVDMVDLFTRVLGVFVHYSDEAVDATVKSWNVRLLALNRQSRHRDATVAQEFWRLLDAHLQARGSTLLY